MAKTSDCVPAARGLVSLVGAGPGDPDLITLKGSRRLQEADVVVYDRLASQDLLLLARDDAELIFVGKSPGNHASSQSEINEILVKHGLAGRSVCRLKGGDPFVFGRGGEEALACRRAGVPFEIVPGITSAIAVPAYAGIPVTHRQVAASFTVVTGHEDPSRAEAGVNWERLANAADTLVLLMGVERLGSIAARLIAAGRAPETPAAVIQWGTRPDQRTVEGTLEDITDRVVEAGITAPAITIVGEVARLRGELAWYENRPLFGCRIGVTRSRETASGLAAMLRNLGAEVLIAPAIRTRTFSAAETPDLDRILSRPFDWVVFNSVNAVQSFFALARELGRDCRCVGTAHIAAVGPVTAAAVESAGLKVDLVPGEAVAIRIAEAFNESIEGKRFLIPRALEAPDDLAESLEARGALVTSQPTYETLPAAASDRIAQSLKSGELDILTFTSSSTVRNFIAHIPASDIPAGVRIVCIGPVTAETARAAGLRVDAVAEQHTIPGLLEAILRLRSGDIGRTQQND